MPRVPTAVQMGLGTQQASAAPTPAMQVRTTPEMFGGGQTATQAGTVLDDASDRIGKAALRIRGREDAVARARDYGKYDEEAMAELRRLETEDDISKTATVASYATFLKKKYDEILLSHAGSADSKAALAAKLEARRSQMVGMASGLAYEKQKALVASEFDKRLSSITAAAQSNPAGINDFIRNIDDEIADLAPGLSPEQETEFRARGRDELAKSVVESFVSRGDWKGAKEILDEMPGVKEMLTPAAQRSIGTAIAAAEKAENDARNKGLLKVQEAENIVGRKLTTAERVKLAGLSEPRGEKSAADKVAEIEAVLGPLDPTQKAKVLGVDRGGAKTDIGKTIEDRALFVRQFGENSPQVKAFDDMANAPSDATMTQVGGMRKEFTALSKDFVTVRDSFNRVISAPATAAGDLSLIYNYMKILDPGSVVRESEFAQAASAGSFGDRIQAAAQRIMTGERLADDVRADFQGRARDLVMAQARSQVALENQYRGIAERNNIPPENVVVDFMQGLRAEVTKPQTASQTQPQAAAQAEVAAPETKRRIVLDLEGNIVNSMPPATAPDEPKPKPKRKSAMTGR